jgi:hypothetical protein
MEISFRNFNMTASLAKAFDLKGDIFANQASTDVW